MEFSTFCQSFGNSERMSAHRQKVLASHPLSSQMFEWLTFEKEVIIISICLKSIEISTRDGYYSTRTHRTGMLATLWNEFSFAQRKNEKTNSSQLLTTDQSLEQVLFHSIRNTFIYLQFSFLFTQSTMLSCVSSERIGLV